MERDADSVMAERAIAENTPSTEKAPMPGGATDWGELPELV